jgi:hypothetical protein
MGLKEAASLKPMFLLVCVFYKEDTPPGYIPHTNGPILLNLKSIR